MKLKVGQIAMALLGFSLPTAISAQGTSQVRIQLNAASLSEKAAFAARVKNDLPKTVVFCTDFSASIDTPQGRRVAPHPFEIQKWTGTRWDTLLTGSDLGNAIQAASVDPRKTLDFQLQINAPGRYRLRLTYLKSDSDVKCPLESQQAKTIISKPFDVKAGKASYQR